MKNFIFILSFLVISHVNAQESLAFKANYSIGVPLSNTSYLKNTSFSGFGLGFGKIFETNFSFSMEANWNYFFQYEDRTTYYFDGGAITTDLFKYRQQIPVVLTVNYFFFRPMRFKFYSGLGLGVNYIEDKILFNAYEVSAQNFGFLLQPKLGGTFAIDESERLHLFVEGVLNYSSNESAELKYHSITSLNLNVGAYFLINQ